MRSGLISRNWDFPEISLPISLENLKFDNMFDGLSLAEDDKSVFVEASLPGIDPKDIEVTFDKGILTIKGEKEEETKKKAYHKQATRSFFYQIAPKNVSHDTEPKARYKNGVMKVSFIKSLEEKPRKISVDFE